VAGRAARSVSTTSDPAEVAFARVLTRSGRWIVLHGVPLAATNSQRVAVIVEPAHPSRIAPLLMSAYGLTEREQQLTRLVLQGFSTTDIADRLVISVHTVQGHLRNVFTKTGVRARRDVVTKIFFAHYEPRFRDNEQRTTANRPLRGGPVAPISPHRRPGQADTFEQRFVDRRKATDRLGQSAFDLFASPARTVFLSDPLRQHGGTSLHVGVVADRPDRRRKSVGSELLDGHWLGPCPRAVNRGPPEVLVALEGTDNRRTCRKQTGSRRPCASVMDDGSNAGE
jgi:DNA-binding CsgD family transcriptional regulator